VYSKFLGGSALIPSLILEYREDESPLKLPYRFRASHASSIHLQYDTLQLVLHGDFSSYGISECEAGRPITTKQGNAIERGRPQEGKEKAVTLVMLLRGSQQRGSMHHHGP
jgi:hypothetical protein